MAVVATLPFAAKFSPNEFSADTMGMCLMPRGEGSAGAWEFDGWDGEDVRACVGAGATWKTLSS